MTASGSVSATTWSRNSPSSMLPIIAWMLRPVSSRHASMRSPRLAMGVSESVECWVCQRRREKLSTTETSCPRAENRIAVGQPRYPSPPRIRTLMTARGYRTRPLPPRRGAQAGTRCGFYAPAVMIPVADLLPPELTAIRATGVVIAILVGGYAIARRRALRNADVLILLLVALGLAIVAGTEIPDVLLSAFSFERENGTRIIGVAIFAILVLFLLVLRAL